MAESPSTLEQSRLEPVAPSPLGLEVSDLQVQYGAVRALKGITLSVRSGEIVALLGANGAGKSTTLKAISGLIRAKSGQLCYRGASLERLSATAIVGLGIAHCPEGRRVFTGLTVMENLTLGGVRRSDKAAVQADVERFMAMFPILGQRRKQTAGTLSGGEQQMLALARALMSRPSLLLLDEPSLGLAPLVIKTIFQTLSALREDGVTMLLVEQNVNLALGIADRAYVLRTGQITLEGKASELRDNPAVAAAYLGSGETVTA